MNPTTDWKEECIRIANGFDRFSALQREGISGVFEIEGRKFIESEISKAKEEGYVERGTINGTLLSEAIKQAKREERERIIALLHKDIGMLRQYINEEIVNRKHNLLTSEHVAIWFDDILSTKE